jgi:PKD repeat protein
VAPSARLSERPSSLNVQLASSPHPQLRVAKRLLSIASIVVLLLASMLLSQAAEVSAADTTRDPLKQPFASDSIWNLPIGADATFVPSGILQSTGGGGMQAENDVLILTPTAPLTPVYYNGDAWSRRSRCSAQGNVLFSAPIPTDFVVPGAGALNPDGKTPNYATAILARDSRTLIQGQPMARCTQGGTATIWWHQTNEDVYALGNSGAHGGSMLSSIGGTVRLGELVPGGAIRHAMKVNLDGPNLYPGLGGFRWPATAKDACAPSCYTGTNPALRMGALLALLPDFDSTPLETDAGRVLAQAFQDYGAYVVDNAGWSVYGLAVEFSPSGRVVDEFRTAWGFGINPPSKATPWARDLDRIYTALAVVDNWDATVWSTVSASAGSSGAGLGLPRAPWALPLPAPPQSGPSAPQNLQAAPDNGQVRLSWQAPAKEGDSPITAYSIWSGTTSGNLALQAQVGNVLNYTDSGLTNGKKYYYQVSAVSEAGEGLRSGEVSATPAVQPLSGDFVWSVSGRTVTFNLTAAGGTPPYRFRMAYGDGTTSDWTTNTQLIHTYSKAGKYKVVLTVVDAASKKVMITKFVTVS